MKKPNKPPQREIQTPALIGTVIVLLLIVTGLWWKFLGPGSAPRSPEGGPQFRNAATGQMQFGSPAEPPVGGAPPAAPR